MNYLRIYFSIISNAAGRTPSILYDKHHIIPQSLGGPDIQTNWIYLTPREHLVAHHLLAKAYPEVVELQSGFNMKKICIKYYDHYRWAMRIKDLSAMIEYSRNKREILGRIRTLLDAIGDTDIDRYLPVRSQNIGHSKIGARKQPKPRARRKKEGNA